MDRCLVCESPIEPFMSFGRMPIANGFLTRDDFDDEYFFDLQVGFCDDCTMVQLTELVDRDRLFHENYAFFSSTSARMAAHFKAFAGDVKLKYLGEDPFVVELGSNDGIMLQNFARDGIRHVGIEPSANVAEVAREKGVNSLVEFFDERLAERLVSEHGQADVALGANVMCHIPELHSVAAGMRTLLKPDGVLIFEDPYLGDVVEKTSYDQIYDEHAFYFSVSSVSNLFERHGLEVVDAIPQDVHGGEMRYVIAHKGALPVSERVEAHRRNEHKLGLDRRKTYDDFRRNCERSRDQLRLILEEAHRDGKRVAGYAATSKSTTVTNYCGISPDLVEYISDTTPLKQGKYSPGVHIPVRSHEAFAANYPDYALLFGWNHATEILAKEAGFRDAGGKWIVYVPEVKVVDAPLL